MPSPQWHIGCSGFHYKEWKEIFYPPKLPQRLWFDHYASHFNTLELNVTFYRYPTLASLQKWYDKAPDGFSFSAKLPRWITHYKRFKETERMMSDFYCLLREGLKEKLACVLFKLPPQMSYDLALLENIIGQADPSFRNVIEFRNESWWKKNVQTILKKNDISFCGVSFPGNAHDDAVLNHERCYYRFHGVPKLFFSEYKKAFLEKIYHQISTGKKLKEIYVYFNNTATPAALKNAEYFKGLVRG